MRFVVIVNPKSGGAAAARRRRRLVNALAASELDYVIRLTERRRHAEELSRNAAEEGCSVVAVGGDGTVHEVASGIITSGRHSPLAVVPVGTGNDFTKMLVPPENPESVPGILRDARVEAVDYGVIDWDGPDGSGHGYFINIGGTGFDAKVAASAADFKYLAGTPRYVAAVLKTLRRWKAPHGRVVVQEAERDVYTFDGDLFLALVGNGRCSGGGFYLTPDASIVDGRLDGCVIRDAPVRRLLTLMPMALRGKHVGQPEVAVHKMERMTVAMTEPMPVQADGEILSDRATRVSMHVVPGGLNVLLPVKT